MEQIALFYNTMRMDKGDNLVGAREAIGEIAKLEPFGYFIDIVCLPTQAGLASIYCEALHKMVHDSNKMMSCDHIVISRTMNMQQHPALDRMKEMVKSHGGNPDDLKILDLNV